MELIVTYPAAVCRVLLTVHSMSLAVVSLAINHASQNVYKVSTVVVVVLTFRSVMRQDIHRIIQLILQNTGPMHCPVNILQLQCCITEM